MTRLLDMTHDMVDDLRDVYREQRSVLAVIRRAKYRDLGRGHADLHLILLETFRLRVGQMTLFLWWDDDPLPNQAHITDDELDEKMVPEIEARRHLWDKPASEDDPNYWDKPVTKDSNPQK